MQNSKKKFIILSIWAPHECRKSKELIVCEQKLATKMLSQPKYILAAIIFA